MPDAAGHAETLDADIARALDHLPADFGGGCSVGKARVMANLIVEHRLDTAVEIGVYRGRSFIPLALAMRARGTGRAIGIDPYASEPAMQFDDHGVAPEVLQNFAREADWDGIRGGVVQSIDRHDLGPFAELVRDTSANAVHRFAPASIGLVHIDGNHDRASVEQDVAMWLPLVRPDGFVVLDDASWDSVRPVLGELRATHDLMLVVDDKHDMLGGGVSDFAVIRVRSEPHPAAVSAATTEPAAESQAREGLRGRLATIASRRRRR